MLINAVHGTGVLSTSACQGVVMSARSCVNRRINLVLRLVSSSNIACASSIAGLRDDNPLLVPAPLSSGVDCVESASACRKTTASRCKLLADADANCKKQVYVSCDQTTTEQTGWGNACPGLTSPWRSSVSRDFPAVLLPHQAFLL